MSETSFRHSKSKVPRLYKEAGRIVQKVKEEGGSFKGLVYQADPSRLKALYALVAETLRHGPELDILLQRTQLIFNEPRLDPWLARVLITDLLWRQRPLSGPAIPFLIVKKYEPELRAQQAMLSQSETQPVCTRRPRFVRINTLKVSKEEVLDFFAKKGWHLRKSHKKFSTTDEEYADFLQMVSSLTDNEFLCDIHVPNLLVFPASMKFYDLEYYHSGALVLQDKASCMPAFLLNPPPGSTVLDMCAAPGMKTTHVASLLNNMGTVYAIEKNAARHKTLSTMVSRAGATCVKPILGDALRYTDKELPNVEYIVVDPTCSGSGMNNREELFKDSVDVSKGRLEKLAGFQCIILRHAMTNFPKVKRIVYSTCSTSQEENEAVIQDVLNSTPLNFKPVVPSDGTDWMKRGSSSYNSGDFGLYARPHVDMTNGFFVAVFERTGNEYVPGKQIMQEIPCEKAQNKNIKKKVQKAPSQSKNNNVSKPVINSVLQKMMKAMSNFSETVGSNTNSDMEASSKNTNVNSNKNKEIAQANNSQKTRQVTDDSLVKPAKKKKKLRA